jgi:adenylate cyclase
MLKPFKKQGLQIALLFGVFALFLLNAAGVFEVVFGFGEGNRSVYAIFKWPEFYLFVALGIVLSLVLPVLSPLKASLLVFVSVIPVFHLGYSAKGVRPLIPMEYILLTVLVLFIIHVMLAYFAEYAQKQKLIGVFGQYVPPELATSLSHDPDAFSLEGESRQLTVMFCDVHDFTSISEQLEPKELARLLNTLFTPITEIIYKHQGIVDKYMGDAVMAFWGAPVEDPHHAGNAVAAAFEIQESLVGLREKFQERGWPEFHMGIGINTGVMNVGNMGSRYRLTYTVIGDPVNLASRLEQLTRVYKAKIIVGEATRRAFPSVTYRQLGLVQVKGKSTLERVFEPCNPATDMESTIVANMHRHNEAIRCYQDREWELADKLFNLLKKQNPDDPMYDYYLARIEEFKTHPPPPDWRGEIRYTVK